MIYNKSHRTARSTQHIIGYVVRAKITDRHKPSLSTDHLTSADKLNINYHEEQHKTMRKIY